MKPKIKELEKRIIAWQHEKLTNQYGLAHLAERTITVIQEEIDKLCAPPGERLAYRQKDLG